MRALVFNGPWDMAIDERDVRRPGPSEALVRVIATGICGSDIHGYTGDTGRRHAGQVMGHEAVGTIVEVGSTADEMLVDAVVSINPVLACGVCDACRRGDEQICQTLQVLGVEPSIDAAFAEFVTVPIVNLIRLPTEMLAHHGALVEPLAVGYHAARRGRTTADDRVLVIGGGPIGQAAALAARRLGAEQLVVSEPDAERRAALRRLEVQAVHPDELRDSLASSIGGPPTVVLDAVGANATLADALAVSSPRARIVLVGMASPSITVSSYALSVDERSLVGSFCYSAAEFRDTVEWASANAAIVDHLVDFGRTLDDGPAVFRDLADGTLRANKVMLMPAIDGGVGPLRATDPAGTSIVEFPVADR